MIKNDLKDLIKKDTKMRGIYRGVVEGENGEHTDGYGRVKCRIHGLHSQSKVLTEEMDGIPTEDLPWCEPAIPIQEAGIETGVFAVPQPGTHVLIFFENENLLRPIYFAAVPAKTDWSTDATADKFVFKTHGGHIVEFDSTEGSEATKLEDPSGTKIEVDSSGAITVIGQKGSDITLSGNINITITGGNCNISTTGTINLN